MSADPERGAPGLLAIVRETWADVLGLADVGPDDDFFDLGGHSLLVIDAADALHERTGLEAPLRIFFEQPTPRRLASRLAQRGRPPSLEPEPAVEQLPQE